LRWNRKGEAVRELLLVSLIERDQIRRSTAMGKQLAVLNEKRIKQNIARRKSTKQATGLETQVSFSNAASSNNNEAKDGLESSETQ